MVLGQILQFNRQTKIFKQTWIYGRGPGEGLLRKMNTKKYPDCLQGVETNVLGTDVTWEEAFGQPEPFFISTQHFQKRGQTQWWKCDGSAAEP